MDRAAGLGDEVEAFVHGGSVDHLVAAGRPVPAWTVLNRRAHASVEQLTELAGRRRRGDQRVPGRGAGLAARPAVAAAALVTGAARADDIVGFQRAVWVPLEPWVIQRSRCGALTYRRVIELASEALADQRPTG